MSTACIIPPGRTSNCSIRSTSASSPDSAAGPPQHLDLLRGLIQAAVLHHVRHQTAAQQVPGAPAPRRCSACRWPVQPPRTRIPASRASCAPGGGQSETRCGIPAAADPLTQHRVTGLRAACRVPRHASPGRTIPGCLNTILASPQLALHLIQLPLGGLVLQAGQPPPLLSPDAPLSGRRLASSADKLTRSRRSTSSCSLSHACRRRSASIWHCLSCCRSISSKAWSRCNAAISSVAEPAPAGDPSVAPPFPALLFGFHVFSGNI